jgi:hypothetical protein
LLIDNGQLTIELLFGWVAICVFWGAALLGFGVLEMAFLCFSYRLFCGDFVLWGLCALIDN